MKNIYLLADSQVVINNHTKEQSTGAGIANKIFKGSTPLRFCKLVIVVLILITQTVSATVSIGTVTSANISADKASNSTNPSGGTWTTLGTFSLTENANSDFPNGGNFTITLPAGWTFNTSVSLVPGGSITGESISSFTSNSITFTFTGASTSSKQNITIDNIQVKATDGGAIPSSVTLVRASGGSTITGFATGATCGTLSQTFGAVDNFIMPQALTTKTAGTAFSIATITAKDQFGTTITTFTGTVNFSTSASGGTVSPTTSSAFTAGVLSTQNITVTKAITESVTATSGVAVGTSNSFSVIAGIASKLGVNPISTPQTVVTSFSVTVESQDANGNPANVTSNTAISLAASGGGILTGNTATILNGTNSIALSGVSYTKAEAITFTATRTSGMVLSTSANSNSVTFNAGPAVKLVITPNITTPQAAGTAFSVTVQAQDANGNAANVTSNTGVSLSFTGIGTLTGNTGTIANGTSSITLTGVTDTKAETVTFTAATTSGMSLTTSSSSNAVVINAGTASKLVITPIGTPQTAGTAFSVTVQAQDANGNVANVTSNTGISLASSGTGTLSGNTGTITSGNSSVTIATVSYTKAESVTFTAVRTSGMVLTTSTNSNSVIFNAGIAAKLAITPIISTPQTVATSFSVTVESQDANGNPANVTSNTGISLAASGAGILTGNTATIANGTNTITLSGVSYTKAESVTFTAARTSGMTPIATSANSNSVVFNAGAFVKLQILLPGETAAAGTVSGKTGAPTAQNAGTNFSVTVNAVDANWNFVSSVTDIVHLVSSDGAATMPADAALASGTRTFSLALVSSGSRTITASDATDITKTFNQSTAVTINAFATSASDYFRSNVSSGLWTTAGTWQSSHNNADWLTATAAPTASATAITIRSGHTVYATTSPLSNNLTVENNGTYEHRLNGGTIPTAAWDANSTLLLSGLTSTYPTSGTGQTFGNVSFTSTPSVAGIDMNASLNCAGDLTMSNVGANALRLTNTATGRTITVGGDFLQTSGTFTTVSSTGTGTITITGNFTLSGGTFNFKEDDGNALITIVGNFSQTNGTFDERASNTAGTATVTVAGNFSVSNGTYDISGVGAVGNLNVGGDFSIISPGIITESSTGSGEIVFTGSGVQTYTSGGTISNNVNFTVNSPSTLQMGTGASPGIITGAGTFDLNAGATLGVTSTVGITTTGGTGNIQVTGTRTFAAGANYIYNGNATQGVGNGLTQNTPANLTIANTGGATVSIATTTTVSGNVMLTSGTLSAGVSAINVSGNWTNNGGTFSGGTGTVTFTGNSAAINGTAVSQAFNNIIISKIAGQTLSVNGSTTSITTNNFTETTGNFTAAATTDINGIFTLTAGIFTAGITMNVAGNWVRNGGTFTTGSGTVAFDGGAQSIGGSASTTFNSVTISNGDVTLSLGQTINGTLTFAGGNVITGANTLSLASGATISGAGTTNGYVQGNLAWAIPTGAPSRTFAIGDGTNYAPATVAFTNVTVAGTLTGSVTAADNAGVAASGIDGSKSVNHSWSLVNSGITFNSSGGNASVTLNWTGVGADADAGSTPASYKVGKLDGAVWTLPATANPTSTSIQATGVTVLNSSFQAGEQFISLAGDYYRSQTSGNWNVAANWQSSHDNINWNTSTLVPDNNAAAITVSSGNTITVSAAATASDLTITGILIISASNTLGVTGDWTKTGTFTANTSTVTFNGSSAQIIGGTTSTSFYNLTINENTAAITVTNSSVALSVINNLTVTQGDLVLSAIDANYSILNDLTVSANGTLTHNVYWDVASKLLSVTGNIAIDGKYSYSGVARAHVQMVGINKSVRTGSNGASAFSILTLTSSSGTISASGNLKINDNFWAFFGAAGGTFSTNGQAVVANSGLLNNGGTVLVNGGSLTVTNGSQIGYPAGFAGVLTVSSGTFTTDNLTIGGGALNGTFNLSGGTANITGNFTISTTGTVTITNSPAINIGGDWTNNKTYTKATETVTFNGASGQAITGSVVTVFNNVNINDAADVTLTTAATINGTLTFTSGNIITGANTLSLATTATISGAAVNTGWVNGKLLWSLPTGAQTKTFAIGDATNYTPALVTFTNVTTAGTLTVSTAASDHANISSSVIDASKSVNRTWTLTNAGTVFTSSGNTSAVTLNFAVGDLDAGTTTGTFVMKYWNGSAWTAPTMGTRNALNTQATGLTAFGDFQIGNIFVTATNDYFRSLATGNWTNVATWQSSHDNINWNNATAVPTNAAQSITIRNGHTVTVDATSSGSNIIIASGGVLNGGSAILSVNGDWTNNGGTFTPSTGTVNFNSTTAAQDINGTAASQTFNNLTVNNSGQTLTVSGSTTALTINSLLTLTAGTFDAGTANISIAGNWTNNGATFTPGSNSVTFTGNSSAINGTVASQTFNTLIINKTSGQSLTVNGSTTTLTTGSITETSGSFISPATMDINGTLTLTSGIYTAGTNTNITGNWTNNGATFTPGSGTVTFDGTGAQAINGSAASQTFNNITIAKTTGQTLSVSGSTTTLTVNNNLTQTTGNFTSPATLDVNGDITISAGIFTSGTNITVAGDWANNSTFTSNSGTVTFDGASAQVISGPSMTTFNNLRLSNTSGISLSSADATVSATLTFLTNGKITTGVNTIIMTSTSASSISGATTVRYINGNLRKGIANGTSVTQVFEIGDATNYTPVNLTFAGTVSGSGNITAFTSSGDEPNIATSTIDETRNVNRYWSLSNSGVGGFTSYTAAFNFLAGDIDAPATTSSFIVGRYNSGWTYPSVGTKTATSTQATGLGTTAFGTFAVGNGGAAVPTMNTQPNSPSVCNNGSTTITTSANSTPTSTITWQVNSGSGFTNLSIASPYSTNNSSSAGVTSSTLTINPADLTLTTYQYRVIFANTKGSVTSNAGTLTVNPLSADNSGVDKTICNAANTTIGLSSTVGHTYSWSPVGSLNNPTLSNPTASPTTTTTYTLTEAITATGCTIANTIIVNVNPLPGNTTTGNKAICYGATSAALGGANNATRSYSWSPGTGLSNANASNPTANPTITTTYTLTETINATGCSSVNSVTVTVNPLPVVTINTNYCAAGGNVQLTANPSGNTYLWSTGGSTQSILVDLAGIYTVTVTTGSGCTGMNAVTVANELVTNGNFNNGNTGFTSGYTWTGQQYTTGTTGLQVEGKYTVDADANDYHNLFYGPDHTTASGKFMIVNGSTSASPTIVWQQTINGLQIGTVYYFSAFARSLNNVSPYAQLQFAVDGSTIGTGAALSAGASGTGGPFTWSRFYGTWTATSTSAVLSIVDLQTAPGGNDFGVDDISCSSISPVTFSATPSGNGGAPVCNASTLNLLAGRAGGASPFTFAWSGPASFSSSQENPSITNVSASNAGTYTLTVTDGYGCTISNTVPVTVAQYPLNRTVSAQTSPICTGTSTNIQVSPGQSGITYQLRNDADDSNIGTVGTGTGTVNLSTGNLTSNTTFNVLATTTGSSCSTEMSNAPTVVINTKSTNPTSVTATATTICNTQSTTLTLNGGGGGTGAVIKWYTVSCGGTAAGTGNSLVVSPSTTTTYYGRWEDPAPCSNNTTCSSVVITVNPLPTDKTPTAQTSPICQGTSTNIQITNSQSGIRYQLRNDADNSNVGTFVNGTGSAAAINLPTGALNGTTTFNILATNATTGCNVQMVNKVTVTVNPSTVINTQPSAVTLCSPNTINLNIGATGTALTYQWRKNTTNISGATASSLSIINSNASHTGSYDVVINATCGNTTSTAVAVTVNVAPAITTHPAGATVCLGSPINLSVTSTGTPLNYQWKKTGSDISGATNSSFAIANSNTPDAAGYTVVVSNVCGTTTSNTATIVVSPAQNIPYTEGYESIVSANTLPGCVTSTNLGVNTFTQINSTHSHTGTKFGSYGNSANDWFFTPGLNLTGGIPYQFSFWYKADNSSVFTSLKGGVGSLPTIASMATVGTPLSHTDFTPDVYQQYIAIYTPSSTGVYYFGVNGTSNPGAGTTHMVIDDLSVVQGCTGTPVAGTASASSSSICLGLYTNLSLTGATSAPGITYQWQSSLSGAGSWTSLSGATASTYSSQVNVSTDYRCLVKCTFSNQTTPSNTVTVNVATTAVTPPYTESLESISSNNALPQCMSATSLGGHNLSYIASTGSNNQVARTGSKYLSFNAKSDDWFFSPAVSLRAGISYQYSFWYITDGQPGWSTLSAAVGTSPSPTSMTTALGSGIHNTTANTYQQYISFFTPSVDGNYFFGIYGEATGQPNFLSIDDISVVQACNDPVTAGTVSAPSLACSAQNFTLDLTGSTIGLGTFYQWQSSASNSGPFANIGPATSSSQVSVSQTSSSWYRCIVSCSFTGNNAVSSPVLVNMNSFLNCFCIPTYANGPAAGDHISRVVLAGECSTLDNNTGISNPSSPYYTRFTSPPVTNTTTLKPNGNYTLSISFGTDVNQYAGAWIDFNQNGTFETNEFLGTTSNGGTNGTVNISFSVPGGTPLGTTRLRVRGGDDSPLLNTNGCGATSSPYGESEDYDISIANSVACNGTPAPGNSLAETSPGVGAALVCNFDQFVLSLENSVCGTGITYQWQNGSSGGGPWTNLTGLTANSAAGTITGQTVTTWYRCVVTCTNSSQTVASTPTQVTQGGQANCYCRPTYASGSINGDYISEFNINGFPAALNNVTGPQSATANNYSYYTSASNPNTVTCTLNKGDAYTVSVVSGSDGVNYYGIWADWNQNGTFESGEFLGQINAVGANTTGTLNFTVPFNGQNIGTVRFRIRGGDDVAMNSTQACGPSNSPKGEAEDYDITIADPPACNGTPTAGITTSSVAVSTSGNPFDIGLSGLVSATGLTFQWQVSGNNINWSNISGLTDLSATTSQVASNYYRCEVTCTSSTLSAYSTPVFIANNPYCIAENSNGTSGGVYISRLRVENWQGNTLLDNGSGASSAAPYYTFYNNVTVPNLIAGSFCWFRVNPGTNTNTVYIEAFVDWNSDGDFDDANESVNWVSGPSTNYGGQITGGTANVANIFVKIPALTGGVTAGNKRLRIRIIDPAANTGPAPYNACATYINGETEDYTINLAPTVCTTPSRASNVQSYSPAFTVVNDNIKLTMGANVNGGLARFEYSTDNFNSIGGQFIQYGSSTLNFVDNINEPFIYVRAVYQAEGCAVDYSAPIQVKTECATSFTNWTQGGDYITQVNVKDGASNVFTSNSTTDVIPDGYQNFQSRVANLQRSKNYTFNITTAGSNNEYRAVWIDYDMDGVFAPAEQVYYSGSSSSGLASGIINIPCGTLEAGLTKMRVVVSSQPINSNPCYVGPYASGEIEEYTVNILPLPRLIVNPSAAVCIPSGTTVNISGGNGTYSWNPTTGLTLNSSGNVVTVDFVPLLQHYIITSTDPASGCEIKGNFVAATLPAGGIVTPVASVVCPGSNKTLQVTGYAGAIQWQVSDNDSTWTDIIGATSNIYTTSPILGKKYFRSVAISSSCYNISSTSAVIDTSKTPVVGVTNVTSSTVTVNWAPYGSGQYNVSWTGGAGVGFATGVTTRNFTISGLNANQDILITVTPVTPVCNGVSPGATTTHTLCARPTVTNLTALPQGGKGFKVSWTAVSGTNAYRIYYRNLSNASWSFVDTVGGTSKTVMANISTAKYAVYVAAKNCPAPGSIGEGSTPILYVSINPTPDCIAPPVLSAISNCPNQISINMTGGSGSYFLTLRKVSPTISTGVTYRINSNDANITVGNQYAGSVWEMFATSICPAGTSVSGSSNIVLVTVKPGCPKINNVVLSHSNCHGFVASWNTDDCAGLGITNYQLLIKKSGALNYYGYPVGSGDHASVTWLNGGVTYNIVVMSVACNGATSAYSVPETITLPSCKEETGEQDELPAIADGVDESVTVYPNPSEGQFYVNVGRTSMDIASVKIELINAIGQVLQTNISEVSGGNLSELVVTKQIADGVYFVRTSVGGNVYVNRLIISREK